MASTPEGVEWNHGNAVHGIGHRLYAFVGLIPCTTLGAI